ncbi:MAG: dihydrolipoyl dehydrogenase, partial [Anaerolineae bacterium]|nr:dihydrolipoyl dehydrogenase [Anaerolineae bacterium]
VEMLPHVLPLEDEEAATEVAKAFAKRGVKILAGHKVEAVEATGTGVKVTVSAAGETKALEAEQALVAIGFRPNSKGLGLEEAG